MTSTTMTLTGEETRLDPEIRNHPYPFYAAMREQRPVFYDKGIGLWLVSRHEDVVKVLRDDVNFAIEASHKDPHFDELVEILDREGGGFIPDFPQDPPEHTRVRKLLDSAFTAHRVKSLEPRIRQIAAEIIESLLDRGKGDAIRDFGVPLTARIICDQLGFDFAEVGVEKISRWTTAVLAQISMMQTREQMVENARHICELQNYIIAKIEERQGDRREDMTSDIVHAKLGDGDDAMLTFKEQVACVKAMLIAGNDTTAAAIANLMLLFATRPGLLDRFHAALDDDRAMTRLVEEVLRVQPPVHGLFRVTTRDVEVGGVTIPAHSNVCTLYASANVDERTFPNPDEFDPTRPNLGQIMTFSAGAHRCIGAALARMEIKVTAQEIARRMAEVRLAMPAEDITYLPTLATQTVERLPLTFSRRKPD